MNNTQIMNFVCWLKNRHANVTLISYFLFLLLIISSFTHNSNIPTISMVEGRAISKLFEAAQQKDGGVEEESKVVRVAVGMRGRQIGSRPPRCERRCSACGHCEAVQVPVVPQVLHQNDNIGTARQDQNDSKSRRRRSRSRSFSVKNNNVAYSRGDDVSNYKPMSWKCKCGDFLFNP